MLPIFSKIWLINISLAAFIIFFGVMGYTVWSEGDETIPEIRTGKSSTKPLSVKGVMERAMPPESAYGIVAEKNLFSSNRSEVILDKQKAGPLKISEKMIFLYGIISTGGRNKALISNPESGPAAGKTQVRDKWVAVGDTMGNFSVAEIRKDRIILADGANTHEILLYDKNKPARQATVVEKSAAPTVVSTGPTAPAAPAAAAVKSGTEPPKSAVAEKKGSSEGEYVIVNTPFGPVKRRVQ